MNKYFYYHANCNDGFTAAWVAWRKFQGNGIYMPVKHGTAPTYPDTPSEIYFLDWCPAKSALIELINKHHKLIVLDHHKTSVSQVEGLVTLIQVELDMNRSGAVVAWDYFFPGMVRPLFLLYIQDRDLWQNEYPEASIITEALMVKDKSFSNWNSFVANPEALLNQGKILVEKRNFQIKRLEGRVYYTNVGGYTVPTVNTDDYISDLGNHLCKVLDEYPFVAIWYTQADGTRKYSLRSIGDFDVSEVAARYGGGGHKNAAGFVIP